jgi:hypothetical protein
MAHNIGNRCVCVSNRWLVNLYCAFGPDGVLRGHKDIYWFSRMSLHPVVVARITSSRGYKRVREGRNPKSLCVVFACVAVWRLEIVPRTSLLDGTPSLPFYRQKKDLRYMRERKRKTEKKGALGLRRPSPPASGSRWSCRWWQRRAHVVTLFITSATCRSSVPAPHPVLACGMVNRPPWRSRMGIKQHSAGPPDAVENVSAHVWPVVAAGHVETRPPPP